MIIIKLLQDPSAGPTNVFAIVLPGNRIPSWFITEKLSSGPSTSITLNNNGDTNNTLLGIAIAVCVRAKPSQKFYCDYILNNFYIGNSSVIIHGHVSNSVDNYVWLFYTPFVGVVDQFAQLSGELKLSCRAEQPQGSIVQLGVQQVFKKTIEKWMQFSTTNIKSPNNQYNNKKIVPSSMSMAG